MKFLSHVRHIFLDIITFPFKWYKYYLSFKRPFWVNLTMILLTVIAVAAIFVSLVSIFDADNNTRTERRISECESKGGTLVSVIESNEHYTHFICVFVQHMKLETDTKR